MKNKYTLVITDYKNDYYESYSVLTSTDHDKLQPRSPARLFVLVGYNSIKEYMLRCEWGAWDPTILQKIITIMEEISDDKVVTVTYEKRQF